MVSHPVPSLPFLPASCTGALHSGHQGTRRLYRPFPNVAALSLHVYVKPDPCASSQDWELILSFTPLLTEQRPA